MSFPPARPPFLARLLAGLTLAALAAPSMPVLREAIDHGVDTKSGQVAISIDNERLVRLPIAASHVSLHWAGTPDAHLTINVGRTPDQLSEDIAIGSDDDAQPADSAPPATGGDADATAPDALNFSEVIWAGGARWVRIRTDRPIERLTVVAMDTDVGRGIDDAGVVDAAVNQPAVITRQGWGANEAYSHNSGGYERFAQQYAPLQKLIVHHTAGRNNDPDPTATIRAIYYDHAVIRGYGDIDYNFLIDAQGRVYEGRRSRAYATGESPTGEDLQGNGVRGSHAKYYNDATMGVVLLGTFTNVMPTTAARTSLVNLLAWKAERHGIDPKGSSTYTNPVTGLTKYLANISGHRNVSVTACPGELFYNTFATLRQDVANKIASTTGASHDSTPPTVTSLTPLVPDPTGARTIPFGLIFNEPVTGLAKDDFAVGGSSSGWTVSSITGAASTYTVNVVAPEGGAPEEGSVKLTLPTGSIKDKADLAGPSDDVSATANFAVDSTPATAVLYAVNSSTAPAGTSFGVSVLFDEPVERFAPTDVEIGGTSNAATPWTVQQVYGEGVTWNFTVNRPDEKPADGTLTIQFPEGMTRDLAGVPSAPSNVIERVIDHSLPSNTMPKASLRADTTLNDTAERVLLTWTGKDVGPAGVKSYDIERSYDGASFKAIGTSTDAQFYWSISPGHTYQFRVRTRDKSGNVGAWATGPLLKPTLTQQSSTAVLFSGSTLTTSYSGYSGGTQRALMTPGAWASYTTTARSLSFVTTRATTRGVVDIWIDGSKVATIDLAVGPSQFRWVAYSKTWSSVGTHTIKVVSVGGVGPRVDIDAFGVIR